MNLRYNMIVRIFLATTVICFLFSSCQLRQRSDQQYSPKMIGLKLVQNLSERSSMMMYRTDFLNTFHYAEACAALGAIRIASSINDSILLRGIEARYQPILTSFDTLPYNHVDANVLGIIPLVLYQCDNDEHFMNFGLSMADKQWDMPRTDGLTDQTRFWIDDVYMVCCLQVEAFKATGKMIYLDRAAMFAAAYLDSLQQPNGLFLHGPQAPFFWGRGNGWVAAGLSELLSVLPQEHALYLKIHSRYERMMVSLLGFQSSAGMWRQLIDHKDAWEESSATAMFAFAMANGISHGFLDADKYQEAVSKAWVSLVDRTDSLGNLADICVGTGQRADAEYYLLRDKVSGDLHGQAPMMWLANELLAGF